MYSVEEELTKTKCPTLKINNLYVHSKFNPVIEARRIVEKHYTKYHVHILYGYGLGYIVDAFLETSEDETIIVIDPLLEKNILHCQEKHLKNDRVIFWAKNNLNTLSYVIAQVSKVLEQQIKVFATPNYNKLFEQHYAETLRLIRDVQSKAQIGKVTSLYFAEMWQENTIRNLPYILKDFSAMELQNKFNIPVVIASGGPSLTKQLKLLKKIEDSVIIIAAGSTISSLLAANIEPDFVVTIDGGEPNFNHFKELELQNTKIIYSVINHFGIRPIFKDTGYVFMGFVEEALQKYFQQKFNVTIPRISGSATVAHFAFSIAQIMNAGPVAFIGQDLAYTNNQTHAKANKHFEQVEDLDDLNVELVEIDGYDGNSVYTSKTFLSMLTSFEEMVRFHHLDQPVFNCTEGGAKISGMDQLKFVEFVEKFVDLTVTKDLSILDAEKNQCLTNNDIISKLLEEKQLLRKLMKKCDEAIMALKCNKSKHTFDTKTLKILEKVDAYLEKNTANTQVHFLLDPITTEVKLLYLEKENESPIEKYERVVGQSNALYTKLKRAYEKTMILLDEVIHDIKGVL